MARRFSRIEAAHGDFIARQHVFFTASAAAQARVNVSPRSTEALRVVHEKCVAYLDRTGSGNETAAHLRADGRLTLMFCSFERTPQILRLYGRGRILTRDGEEYARVLEKHFDRAEPLGARQIVILDVDLVQTSCGFGVPLFDYREERDTLERWSEAKGPAALDAYRQRENRRSIDGLPTGL